MFTLHKSTKTGRRGTIHTKHGDIETPFFMPVGTAGAMKGITHDQLIEVGAQILLSNTYHLLLQPGDDVIAEVGGLHEFIHWNKPMLTDSGGYQVFSFGKNGRTKVREDGVEFQSHLDGATLFIGPEESMSIQHNLGADMIMCFDECPPSTASRNEIISAVEKTLRWAKICKKKNDEHNSKTGKQTKLFGIVQGGLERDLREKCAEELIAIGFDGYAIGGLAVGESESEMIDVTTTVCPLLPEDKPRYLMGVGDINQMRQAIALGIDMFDCVLPMRIARHGTIIMSDESTLRIQKANFKHDHSIIEECSPSHLSRVHTKSYLHHLYKAHERLFDTIAGMQNVGVTLKAMQDIRKKIEDLS